MQTGIATSALARGEVIVTRDGFRRVEACGCAIRGWQKAQLKLVEGGNDAG